MGSENAYGHRWFRDGMIGEYSKWTCRCGDWVTYADPEAEAHPGRDCPAALREALAGSETLLAVRLEALRLETARADAADLALAEVVADLEWHEADARQRRDAMPEGDDRRHWSGRICAYQGTRARITSAGGHALATLLDAAGAKGRAAAVAVLGAIPCVACDGAGVWNLGCDQCNHTDEPHPHVDDKITCECCGGTGKDARIAAALATLERGEHVAPTNATTETTR